MLEGSIIRALVAFMIPFLLSSLFQHMYNVIDTVIVGRVLGEASLAAVGSSAVIYETLIGFAFGIGNGMSMVTARYFGAKDQDSVRYSAAGSLAIGAGVTVLLMVVAQLFCYPILKALNTPADILEEAYDYIRTITLFVGVMIAYNLLSGLLKAVGNSIMPLVFLIVSSVLNILLDLLFIQKFGMGVKGAALATVLAQLVSVILCAACLWKDYRDVLPSRKHLQVPGSLYSELLGQGVSMGLMSSLVSVGTVVMQSAINNLGYLIIAGHTAAKKVRSITMLPISSVGMALATFVSQNRGADQGERIRKAVRYVNIMGFSWSFIISIIMYFAAPWIIGLVSGSANEQVLQNGALYLQLNCLFFGILSVLFNNRYSLQGIGSKMLPLVSSVIELVGKIIFSFLFIPVMGYLGVILCEPVIWCFMAAELVVSFYTNPYIKANKPGKTA